jgi:putative membrane protein
VVGACRLWLRSGGGRERIRSGALLFVSGWAMLAAALASPLDTAGARSFTLHMIEHELVMLPAALLLVLARPGPALLWALPAGARTALGGAAARLRAPWRAITEPVTATVLQAIAMIAWHLPPLFERALAGRAWHIAQHGSFLLTALLFWWAMAHARTDRSGFGLAALCLFVTSLVGGALGALMSFASSPWYATYAAMGMTPSGLTPIEDQQLAGLLMWIPGGLFHAAAALTFLYFWLKASETRHEAPAL